MDWIPHLRQEEALRRVEFEILYGGARGGGKTDAGLAWLTEHYNNPRFRGLVIRKNADDLSDWVDRARFMYNGLDASFAYRPTEITFGSGARIRTGHLKDDQAYTKYQGHEYQRILIEELTQIPDEKRYLQLISSCRSTIPDIKPQIFLTTNPGGLGHAWVKERFVDIAPPNKPYWYEFEMADGRIIRRSRIFIPAKVEDNPSLMDADPGYVLTLEMLKDTDEELWKAWRMGSWDVFAGQYFKNFRRDIHVTPQHFPTSEGYIIGSMDWGRVDNFAFYLHHVIPVHFKGQMFRRVKTFLEVYGNDEDPAFWARRIKERLEGFNLKLTDLSKIPSDNQIFQSQATDRGVTIADQFVREDEKYRTLLIAASKNRVAGWEAMQKWLSLAPDGYPYWQISESCINLIKEIPSAVRDENKVEDIDDSGVDDALDSVRYGFSDIKFIDATLTALQRGQEAKPKNMKEEFEAFKDDVIDDYKQVI